MLFGQSAYCAPMYSLSLHMYLPICSFPFCTPCQSVHVTRVIWGEFSLYSLLYHFLFQHSQHLPIGRNAKRHLITGETTRPAQSRSPQSNNNTNITIDKQSKGVFHIKEQNSRHTHEEDDDSSVACYSLPPSPS